MSNVTRALSGANLSFDLAELIDELRADEGYRRSGRVGRTLVKDGYLRLTLIALAEGMDIGTHHADAPMTLQPLGGQLRYRVDGTDIDVGPGDVLFFGPGLAKDVSALEDAALLLTITTPGNGSDVETTALAGGTEAASR